MEWTIIKIIQWTTDYFKSKFIPSPRLDAELLLSYTLNISRVQIYTNYDRPLTKEELSLYKEFVKRRANYEPIAYIVGKKEFWGIDFIVGPGVLIPRPDTELLVSIAIEKLESDILLNLIPEHSSRKKKSLPWSNALILDEKLERTTSNNYTEDFFDDDYLEKIGEIENINTIDQTNLEQTDNVINTPELQQINNHKKQHIILDICTGSGIIPICLARDCNVRAIAVDISKEALFYARQNVANLAPPSSIAILEGNLLDPVPKRFYGKFDLITSNPPYITNDRYNGLQADIINFEPKVALLGGVDGMDFYKKICSQSKKFLSPDGWLMMEIGYEEQADYLYSYMSKDFKNISIRKDLSGQSRVIIAQIIN